MGTIKNAAEPAIEKEGLVIRFRRSPRLIVFVVFIAMMLDLIMMTTLEPILPDILYQLHVRRRPIDNLTEIGSYSDTSKQIGTLLGIKPGIEVFANIIVGYIVQRCGHKYPMIIGCIGNLVAILGFAYVNTFELLIASRVIQAIGSSLSVVSGLAMIACVFTNDEDRAWANGIAFGGLSTGLLVGFPFGSSTYQYAGRKVTFLILASLVLVDGVMRMSLIVPEKKEKEEMEQKLINIIKDIYVIVALVCNFLVHGALGVVITTEAAWMLDTFNAQQWQIGVILCVAASCQLTFQYFVGIYSTKYGRWVFCFLSMIVMAIGLAMYPMCNILWHLIGPEILFRISLGAILCVLSPMLAFIADLRHGGNYGVLYGLYAASYNLGLCFGSLSGGALLHKFSFTKIYFGMSAILLAYSVFTLIFRNLELKENKKCKLSIEETSYGTFAS